MGEPDVWMRMAGVWGVAEIALDVGYGSQGAFGGAFRRIMGSSPGAFRRARFGR